MKYLFGLVVAGQGLAGQQVYTLVYTPNGNAVSQMSEKGQPSLILAVEGYDNIREVVVNTTWTHVGYVVGEKTSPEELERFFRSGTPKAVTLDESYLTTEAGIAVQKEPLYSVLKNWLYEV